MYILNVPFLVTDMSEGLTQGYIPVVQGTIKKRRKTTKLGPKLGPKDVMILGDESDGHVDGRATTEKKPTYYTSNLCMSFSIRYDNSSFFFFF